MVDVATLSAAIGGLKTAGEIAVGLGKLHTLTEVKAKTIDLQQVILAVQTSLFEAQDLQRTLLGTIDGLKAELRQVKDWETERQKYELVDVSGAGVMAYTNKKDIGPTQPDHKICATCYEDGRKSILQPQTVVPGMAQVLICGRCHTVIYQRGVRHPDHKFTRAK